MEAPRRRQYKAEAGHPQQGNGVEFDIPLANSSSIQVAASTVSTFLGINMPLDLDSSSPPRQ